MLKALLYGTVALLPALVAGSAEAAPFTLTGTYTLSVLSGGTGNNPTFTDDGNGENAHYNGSGTQYVVTMLSPFTTPNLTLNVATPAAAFFIVNPASSSGLCGGNGQPTCNANNQTVTDTVQVKFTFTTPTGAAGNFTEQAQFEADYYNDTDSLDWSSSNNPMVVSFTDGSVVDITFNNASDWDIAPTISFTMTTAPCVSNCGGGVTGSKIPEPASLGLLGSALVGLGAVRRRRTA